MRLLLLILTFLSADFEQVKTSQLFAEPEHSNGHLTYRQPDYLRWEYTQPQPLVWEVDGAKGNVSPQVRQVMTLILKSISGEYLQPNNDFDVKQNGDIADLTPKRRELKQLFRKITIRINPKTGIADEVVLFEKNGDETKIRFTNAQRTIDE
jgi:outer membrane lipoprotein-sorting protein